MNPDSAGTEASGTFWASARRPRHPAAKYVQAAYNPPPPEPDPAPAPIEAVATMDQATYAANRDSIMGISRRPSSVAWTCRPAAPRSLPSR